jgi:hypothetical protein
MLQLGNEGPNLDEIVRAVAVGKIETTVSRVDQSDAPPEEFGEIGNCGGKIELIRSDGGVAMRVSGKGQVAWVQMGIALDGSKMTFWPLQGLDTRPPHKPAPMVPAFLPADRTGLWGRRCPNCKAYFRTAGIREEMLCPYCGCHASAAAFTTENQREFLNAQRKLWLTAFDGGEEVIIDLDTIASELPANRPVWTPTEYKQQFHFRCEGCQTASDILGEYASCPACGERNNLAVLCAHLDILDEEFNSANSELQGRYERERKWESLLPRYTSTWEAMANDLQKQLSLLLMTPKRRKEVAALSFQQIEEANKSLEEWFGINFLTDLKEEDRRFLIRIVNRRHLLVHRAGRVDEEYLRKTGDETVKLHQRIRVRSAEVARLSKLLRLCSLRLFEGFVSIS